VVQVAPPVPQAVALGVTHEPLTGSQQPWQLAGPHEQVPVAVWQEMPAGQSASVVQPQRPLVHTLPTADAWQSTQAPDEPQLDD
jgi:hypothetical protein